MSIDLEWDKLNSSLATSLVDVLNRQLANTPRPSFIGPIEITSLDFGSVSPDVEVVDLRDIYRDFLEDDEDDEAEKPPAKTTQGADDDEDDFEWVSRKACRAQSLPEDVPAYHLLPPHMRYRRSSSMDMFASTPSIPSRRGMWNPGMSNLMDLRPTYPSASYAPFIYYSPAMTPFVGQPSRTALLSIKPEPEPARSLTQSLTSEANPSTAPAPDPTPPKHPNLQLHLHVTWHSNLRLTLTTSLLINYPSPMFMSLPIKLSVTGVLFNGEVAVAYEGEHRRIHICILDDLDPYGPLAGERPKRDSPASATPPDPDDELSGSPANPTRGGKPLPVGQRLLPSIYIESEIGQADKHVLKNVTRVERFIQDVIRKTVEEELVFPNFHTLLMADA